MSKIAQLIDSVQANAMDKKKQARLDLEQRRATALERIGQAAAKCGLNLEDSQVLEMLQDRLKEAQGLRISHAEALADLAESRGDFESKVQWWELYNDSDDQRANRGSATLWKGYVLGEFLVNTEVMADSAGRSGQSGQFADERSTARVTVMLRRACAGGYVAVVKGRRGYSAAPSLGEDGSPRTAIEGAYRAYFEGRVESLPVELEQQLAWLLNMEEEQEGSELDNGVGAELG